MIMIACGNALWYYTLYTQHSYGLCSLCTNSILNTVKSQFLLTLTMLTHIPLSLFRLEPRLCRVCVDRWFEWKPLGIFHLPFSNPIFSLIPSNYVGLVRITYICELPELASLKNPCFLCTFSGQTSSPIFQHFIAVLRDMIYLYTCDTRPTLPDFRTKPASPVPPEYQSTAMQPSMVESLKRIFHNNYEAKDWETLS